MLNYKDVNDHMHFIFVFHERKQKMIFNALELMWPFFCATSKCLKHINQLPNPNIYEVVQQGSL